MWPYIRRPLAVRGSAPRSLIALLFEYFASAPPQARLATMFQRLSKPEALAFECWIAPFKCTALMIGRNMGNVGPLLLIDSRMFPVSHFAGSTGACASCTSSSRIFFTVSPLLCTALSRSTMARARLLEKNKSSSMRDSEIYIYISPHPTLTSVFVETWQFTSEQPLTNGTTTCKHKWKAPNLHTEKNPPVRTIPEPKGMRFTPLPRMHFSRDV